MQTYSRTLTAQQHRHLERNGHGIVVGWDRINGGPVVHRDGLYVTVGQSGYPRKPRAVTPPLKNGSVIWTGNR